MLLFPGSLATALPLCRRAFRARLLFARTWPPLLHVAVGALAHCRLRLRSTLAGALAPIDIVYQRIITFTRHVTVTRGMT